MCSFKKKISYVLCQHRENILNTCQSGIKSRFLSDITSDLNFLSNVNVNSSQLCTRVKPIGFCLFGLKFFVCLCLPQHWHPLGLRAHSEFDYS